MRCCMLLSDIYIIRRIRHNHTCQVSFKQRHGLPFLIQNSLRNSGIVIGVIGFLTMLFLFSNMVLGIDIKGAKPETKELIQKELTRLGVKVGKLQFSIVDIETIQRSLTNNIASITWVGVELKGTTFELKVVEKSEPDKLKTLYPRNLVASKEAVITGMYVEKGQPMVMVNDHVQKGQLLVSGVLGEGENSKVIPAVGVVYGETWYETKVRVPLHSTFSLLTGKHQSAYFLKLGNLKIKIWGFAQNKYKNSVIEIAHYPFHFLNWTIPITFLKEMEKEQIQQTRDYTKEEALQVANEISQNNLKKILDKHAKIIGGKVLDEKISSSKELTVFYHYRVIEDIAQVQKIISPPSPPKDEGTN